MALENVPTPTLLELLQRAQLEHHEARALAWEPTLSTSERARWRRRARNAGRRVGRLRKEIAHRQKRLQDAA